MAKRKTRSNRGEEYFRQNEYNITQRNSSDKKALTLTALVVGTFCGLTSAVMGIALHSKNQPVQPMLIPAILMGLSYGSIGRIERYYDKKTIEEIQQLKKRYK